MGRFAGFELATGKFPKLTLMYSSRALGDEDVAAAAAHHANCDINLGQVR